MGKAKDSDLDGIFVETISAPITSTAWNQVLDSPIRVNQKAGRMHELSDLELRAGTYQELGVVAVEEILELLDQVRPLLGAKHIPKDKLKVQEVAWAKPLMG